MVKRLASGSATARRAALASHLAGSLLVMSSSAWAQEMVPDAPSGIGAARTGEASAGLALWVRIAPNAEGCPPASEVRKRVASRLGRDPFAAAEPSDGEIFVTFSRKEDAYHAKIALRRNRHTAVLERQFADGSLSCDALAEAAILGITLLVEGEAASPVDGPSREHIGLQPQRDAAIEPTPPPSAERAPPSPGVEPRYPPSGADDNRAGGPASELSVVLLVSRGVVPATGWGGAVSGAIVPRARLGIRWGADYLAGDTISHGTTSYQFTQSSAWLGVMLPFEPVTPLVVAPEAELMAGVTHAAVLERDPVDPGDHPFLGVRTGATITLHLLGPMALRAGALVRAPFTRVVFRANGRDDPVWAQPHFGFTAEVGVVLRYE